MGLRDRITSFDRFQQRHRALAFPLAVWKKFGDDQGSNLVGLLAFFAFVSVFPLLLVVVTLLGIVLNGHPDLQHGAANSALVELRSLFPPPSEPVTAESVRADERADSAGMRKPT
jgi:uncharacterized BrkB/YihY/UPF0761 family membrane protein